MFFTQGSKLVIFWFLFSTVIFSEVVKRPVLPYDLKNYADLLLSSSIHITVNDLIDIREVYYTLTVQGVVYFRNCNTFNKTKMLSTKISKEFNNTGISSPSIDTTRPSWDPCRSFKSQLNKCNDVTILAESHCVVIISPSLFELDGE